MGKYIVAWESIDEQSELVINIREFEDIQFKEMYIRSTDDDTGDTFYIPYTSIYDIKYVKTEENDQQTI